MIRTTKDLLNTSVVYSTGKDQRELVGALQVKTPDELIRRLRDQSISPRHIVLVADIILLKPLTLPTGDYSVSGDGYSITGELVATKAIQSATLSGLDLTRCPIRVVGDVRGLRVEGCQLGPTPFISAPDGGTLFDTTITGEVKEDTVISPSLNGVTLNLHTPSSDTVLTATASWTNVRGEGNYSIQHGGFPLLDSWISISGDWLTTTGTITGSNIVSRNYNTFTATGGVTPPVGNYGDITVSVGGTQWDINAGVVGTTELADGAVTLPKIQTIPGRTVLGRSSGTTGVVGTMASSTDGHVLRQGSGTLGFGTIPQASVDNLVTDLTTITTDVSARVVGPASSTDNAVTRFDGTTGKLVQNSVITISDTGLMSGLITPVSNSDAANKQYVDAAVTAGTLPDGDKGDITVSGGGSTWTVDTGAITTAKIVDAAVTLSKLQTIPTDSLLGRDTAGTGVVENITLGASLSLNGSKVLQRAALTGDVTASVNSNATVIGANVVSNTKLRDSVALSVMGNATAATADPSDLVAGTDGHVLRRAGTTLGFGLITQGAVTNLSTDLSTITTNVNARVVGPASSTDNAIARWDTTTGKLLQDSGITISDTNIMSGLAAPAVGTDATNKAYVDGLVSAVTVPNGDKGDITVSAGGTVWSIDADAVTTAKIANNAVDGTKLRDSAATSVIGRKISAGDPEDITAPVDGGVLRRFSGELNFGNIPQSSVDNLETDIDALQTDIAARVIGPLTSTDNAITRWDGTTGKYIQNSAAFLSDVGNISAEPGTASLPAYSFTGKTDTGMYAFFGAKQHIQFAINGAQQAVISNNGDVSAVSSVFAGAGETFGFTGTDTSIKDIGGVALGFIVDSTSVAILTSTQILAVPTGDVTAPVHSFAGSSSAASSGMDYDSTDAAVTLSGPSDSVSVGRRGSLGYLYDTAKTAGLRVLMGPGSAGAPTYSLGQDDTGIYRPFLNVLSVTLGGTPAHVFTPTSFYQSTTAGAYQLFSRSDNAAEPPYSFVNNSNTGMYREAANTIGWSTNGSKAMTLDVSNVLTVVGAYVSGFTDISTTTSPLTINASTGNLHGWSCSKAAAHQVRVTNLLPGQSVSIWKINSSAGSSAMSVTASATGIASSTALQISTTPGAVPATSFNQVTGGRSYITVSNVAGSMFVAAS